MIRTSVPSYLLRGGTPDSEFRPSSIVQPLCRAVRLRNPTRQAVLCFLMLSAILMSSCGRERPRPALSVDDFLVYESVLNYINMRHAHQAESPSFLVVDQSRSAEPMMPPVRPGDPELWGKSLGHTDELRQACRDFEIQRLVDLPMSGIQSVRSHCVVARAALLDSLMQAAPGGFDSIAVRYHTSPNGFFTFSRVGFSDDITHALVYAEYSCGPLCGYGGYYFLEKDKQEWHVLFQPGGTWVS
jgi:hypothetical protein